MFSLPQIASIAIFLIIHGTAHWQKWYYKYPRIDMITHFFGGLALGAFIKDWQIALALIIAWELLEMLLVKENREAFKERPLNKLSDLFFGIIGFMFGLEFL